MRYMFLVYSKETDDATPQALQEIAQRHQAVMEEARRKDVFEAADPLTPTSTATTVRATADGGRMLVTDGPFAETKEQLAGYYIIDCQNLDEAIEWAQKIPSGCKGGEGCIEIRPIHEMHASPQATPKREQWIPETA